MADWTTAEVIAAFQRAVDADQRRVLEIVQLTAIAHESYLQRTYPVGRTGNLRSSIFISKRNEFSWRVSAGAPHVHIWEDGTRQRRTRRGFNRGVSPAKGPVFVPAATRYRADMIRRIQVVLDRPVEV